MLERYARNIPALTEAECALLRTKRVLVVGCGGLGGHIIDLLTRVGVGTLRVVDGDVFEPSNLNRQLLSNTATLGRPKAEVATEHIRRVSPNTAVEAVACFMTEENVRELIRDCDIVMDALDSISARRTLAKACADAGIPVAVTALSDRAKDLRQAELKNMAVVIGSEGRGVRQEVLDSADAELIIPMNSRCESLNAAIAAAIVMWEMK